jgi:hypothetical protein
MPGHAGNFLTRLFSLSPETVPQVPVHEIMKSIEAESPSLPLINRLQSYSYKKVPTDHADWQTFHRQWPDYYNRHEYKYFNELYDPSFSHIVYSIHPHEFYLLKDHILQEDADFYHVDLESRFDSWVFGQQKKLGFKYRPDYAGELDRFNQIRIEHRTKPISLTAMLTNENLFVQEYVKTVESMGLTADVAPAIQLYRDWIAVRGPE